MTSLNVPLADDQFAADEGGGGEGRSAAIGIPIVGRGRAGGSVEGIPIARRSKFNFIYLL